MVRGDADLDRLLALATLSAGIAHEIKNPLTSVLLGHESALEGLRNLSLALAATGPAAVAQAAGIAGTLHAGMEALVRIRDLVASVNTFGSGDALADQPASLREAVASAIRLSACEIRPCAAVLFDGTVDAMVAAGPARLSQVFVNLLVNAAHSMDPARRDVNRIRVTITADQRAAQVDVEDTGCGIAPESLDKVFDPFFTTKPPAQGSGLGLSICRATVVALGGRIELRSVLGQGSRFTVHLPVLATGTAASDPGATPPPASGAHSPGGT